LPVKPFILVTVTVKLVEEPGVTACDEGVVTSEKSPEVKVAP